MLAPIQKSVELVVALTVLTRLTMLLLQAPCKDLSYTEEATDALLCAIASACPRVTSAPFWQSGAVLQGFPRVALPQFKLQCNLQICPSKWVSLQADLADGARDRVRTQPV